ncbi:MAG TPA: PIG-L family deacetylase [Allosphingosinicella sp.]
MLSAVDTAEELGLRERAAPAAAPVAGLRRGRTPRFDGRATGPVYVVSPHCDDAALSMASTLRALAHAGHRIVIINCFSRSDWAPRASAAGSVDEVTRLRRREDLSFGALIGGDVTFEWLDLPDATLRPDWRVDASGVVPPDRKVVAQYTEILAARLSAVATPGGLWAVPMGLGHRDHRMARAAALEVVGDWPFCFYEDIPYVYSRCPAEVERSARAVAGGDELRRLSPADDPAFWRAAAACYPSQFDESEIDTMLAQRLAAGGEHLWATPAVESLVGRF